MIRNGVIGASREFAERRYRTEAGRRFDAIKATVLQRHGIDIKRRRETYYRSAERPLAVVGDLLVDTVSTPLRIGPWADVKRR